MRLIDADALERLLADFISDDRGGNLTVQEIANNEAIVDTMKAIHEQPTVEAVPVIRCKECKYYEETDETIGTCLLTESGAHIKGYCSWAEVREE